MAKAKKKTPSKTSRKPKAVKAKAAIKVSAAKKTVKATTDHAKKPQNIPTILEYKLFCEDSVRSLEDQVNYHIGKGWAPVGGVVLQGSGNFLQTMVRHQ